MDETNVPRSPPYPGSAPDRTSLRAEMSHHVGMRRNDEAVPAQHPNRPWWEPGIVYQIYPRSFQDSDGDGTGDLPGITQRLDYLQWLGIDAIWISPIFRSPMKDFGYDISDYCDVDPIFGTLADLDRLVTEAHRRHIKVLLDFVPNHTSDQHPWFKESRASRTSPKRDWYIWRDPGPGGAPPNNWLAAFGGSAWTLDETTGQFWYHAFLPEQPDLNWRNRAVRDAMYDVLRFWFGRGIDGFRIDVITHLLEDEEFRDNPPNPHFRVGEPSEASLIPEYTTDHPNLPEIIREMRVVTDEHDGRLLIGEAYLPVARLVTYYGAGQGLHMPFNFQLVTMPWDAGLIGEVVTTYEGHLPENAWPNWVLGNHDQKRVATRVGDAQARVAAMLLLTLRGTPTIYYGDELGMHDVDIPPERRVDPAWHDGSGYGRDPGRTPMQWSAGEGAGFTTGRPWLPIAADAATRNVEAEQADPASMLTLHRRLIELRRREPALAIGAYEPLVATGHVLAFRRAAGGRAFAVALNLGPQPVSVPDSAAHGRIVLATNAQREGQSVAGVVELAGDEGVIVELEQTSGGEL
jgi:alpha-glucosidase